MEGACPSAAPLCTAVVDPFHMYPTVLCLQILKRLYKALSLLKKEFELSKLQQRLGREVTGGKGR